MAHVLRVEQKGTYLHAVVEGDNTTEDVRQYLAEVRKACEARGCTRVLVEENLRGPSLKTMEIFAIAAGGGSAAAGTLSMVAYMDVNPEHAVRDMQFAENVAANRGLNVRLFLDRREAEAWLAS